MRPQLGVRDDWAYRATILREPNLIGYWPGGETNGQMKDLTANARHGTVTGARRAVPAEFGPVPLALPKYDGVDDNTSIAHNTAFDFGATTTFTVEAWLAWTGNASATRVIAGKSKTTSNFAGWEFYISGSTNVLAGIRFGAANTFTDVQGTAALKIGVLYHAAWTYDGSNTRLYINAALDKTAADTRSLVTATLAMGIGDEASAAPYAPFNGYLGHVAMYSGEALSAAKLASHYRALFA